MFYIAHALREVGNRLGFARARAYGGILLRVASFLTTIGDTHSRLRAQPERLPRPQFSSTCSTTVLREYTEPAPSIFASRYRRTKPSLFVLCAAPQEVSDTTMREPISNMLSAAACSFSRLPRLYAATASPLPHFSANRLPHIRIGVVALRLVQRAKHSGRARAAPLSLSPEAACERTMAQRARLSARVSASAFSDCAGVRVGELVRASGGRPRAMLFVEVIVSEKHALS